MAAERKATIRCSGRQVMAWRRQANINHGYYIMQKSGVFQCCTVLSKCKSLIE